MNKPQMLLKRLDDIGLSLERKGGALILLGVGSSGQETDRMDEYSDLDFFVIVENGHKTEYLNRLDWLEQAHPLAYSFRNTADGCKILFEDGIYGEYAIFEEEELKDIPYSGGRIVWQNPGAGPITLEMSNPSKTKGVRSVDPHHALNEALTNLYVGLLRYARGEKLSALQFVQGYAITSILSVLHLFEQEEDYFPDPFGNERRLERRFPGFAGSIGGMLQGYDRVPESALNILNYLESIYDVNERLGGEIRRLAKSLGQ